MSLPLHFVVPGPLAQATGGYIYDRRIIAGLRGLGRTVNVHELAGAFPAADERARQAAASCLEATDGPGTWVIDGLALPAFSDLAPRMARPWLALVHHPLALETGLVPERAAALASIERRLVREAARIVATSPRTRRDLEEMGIALARIGVVPPGTDPAPVAHGSGNAPTTLLCVASLIPRKGHLVLLEALAGLQDLAWRLVCAGSTTRDPATAAAVLAAIEELGLHDRVEVLGEVPDARLASLYAGADLFVLASFHEGYGMVLAEALARGLPIVATAAGAIPETVPGGAAVLVPPGDAAALAARLRGLLREPGHLEALRRRARSARRHLPGWEEAARAFAREMDQVA